MHTRRTVVGVVFVAALIGSAPKSFAGSGAADRPFDRGGAKGSSWEDQVKVEVVQVWSGKSSTSSDGDQIPCQYLEGGTPDRPMWAEGPNDTIVELGTERVVNGVTQKLVWRSCWNMKTDFLWSEILWMPRYSGEQLSRLFAFDDVKRTVPKPLAQFAPDGRPDAPTYVQVPTWFWVPEEQWRTPISATASVPGLSATVTATPRALRFDPGDAKYGSGSVSCGGPGTPFAGAMDLVSSRSDCSYVYRHTPGAAGRDRWKGAVSIEWDVVWSATDGSGGVLPPIVTTIVRDIDVREIQAVVTKG